MQPTPLRLIIEQEHQRGAVGGANRHRSNRIGLVAGAEIHLPARSLLVQGPLQVRRPLGRYEGLPRPADQTRGRRIHQIGKSAVGPADPATPIHDAEGGGDGVDHLLPGAAAVVVEVHQTGALERDAGLCHQTFQQPEGRGAEAARLAPDRHGAGHPAARDKRREEPRARGIGLRRQVALGGKRVETVGQHQRTQALDQLEHGAAIGAAGGPGVHEVLGVGVPVEKAQRDFRGGEAFPDMLKQEIDDRCAA